MSAPAPHAPRRAFAVVPAAGDSRRMGTSKLLLPWGAGGATVIETVLAAWRSSCVERVVVTVRPGDDALAALCRRAQVDVVVPIASPRDMKASIALGLAHLAKTASPTEHDVWLFAPSDLPMLSAATIDRIVGAFDPSRPTGIRPRHAGKFGHPVLWPWSAAAEVGNLPDDRGLDALFERLPYRIVECADDCVAGDLDTPDDYRRLRDRYDRHDA